MSGKSHHAMWMSKGVSNRSATHALPPPVHISPSLPPTSRPLQLKQCPFRRLFILVLATHVPSRVICLVVLVTRCG